MSDRVLAVIVSYNPEIATLVASINRLLASHCQVLVVDNASANQAQVEKACAKLLDDAEHGATLRQTQNHLSIKILDSNLGLAYAHNEGVKKMVDEGFDYLLLLDQDTVLSEDYLATLLSTYAAKSEQGIKISAVGGSYAHGSQDQSVYIRFGALKFSRHGADEQDQDGCVATDFLISSGSLINLQALSEIGTMDEALFIDHVDTEWFLRARSKGYQAYGVPAAKMQHGLGEVTHVVNMADRQRNVPQHKPFRYYYIFRNSILLYRRGYVSWLWKWNDFQRLLMIFIMFALLKPPRLQNARMMLKGFWHGVRGKVGELSE